MKKKLQSSTSRSLCWIEIRVSPNDNKSRKALTNYANFYSILSFPPFLCKQQQSRRIDFLIHWTLTGMSAHCLSLIDAKFQRVLKILSAERKSVWTFAICQFNFFKVEEVQRMIPERINFGNFSHKLFQFRAICMRMMQSEEILPSHSATTIYCTQNPLPSMSPLST